MATHSLFDVFLSHNSKDKPFVRRLGEAIKKRGFTVWLDEWELIPGRPWQEALEEIIRTAKSALVLIGETGIGPWENPEMRALLNQAVLRKLPVIPVLLPGASPYLPLFLQTFTWVDLRQGLTKDGLDLIEWGITGTRPDQPGHGVQAGFDYTADNKHGRPRRLRRHSAVQALFTILICIAAVSTVLLFTSGSRSTSAINKVTPKQMPETIDAASRPVARGVRPPDHRSGLPPYHLFRNFPTEQQTRRKPNISPTKVTFKYENRTDTNLRLILYSCGKHYEFLNDPGRSPNAKMDWPFPPRTTKPFGKFLSGSGWYCIFVAKPEAPDKYYPIECIDLFCWPVTELVVKDTGNAAEPYAACIPIPSKERVRCLSAFLQLVFWVSW